MGLDDSVGCSDLAGELEALITAVRELEAHGKKLRRDFNSCYSDQESLLKDVVKCRKTTTQLTKALKGTGRCAVRRVWQPSLVVDISSLCAFVFVCSQQRSQCRGASQVF